MILVDSSVWIDYFRGCVTDEVELLDRLLGVEPLLTGDLILVEVLQGFDKDTDYQTAYELLTSFEIVTLGGREIAIHAAENYRSLRRIGITVRKTIDTIIATKCIQSGYSLLHSDRDFDAFSELLGLQVVAAI